MGDWLAEHLGVVFLVATIYMALAKNYLNKNPDVKDAAKKAVAAKAVGVIGRLLK